MDATADGDGAGALTAGADAGPAAGADADTALGSRRWAMSAADVRLGVDVGGTFTDLVAVDGRGRLTFAKVPSVPGDQGAGVLAAFGRSALAPERVARFAHGTTVATNTLLERNGAVTALVTTAGFRDILEIGRQDRPALYDLTRRRAEPLVPRSRRFPVTERSTPEGVTVPLRDDEVLAVADALAALPDLEAVAVCLLFSFLHPEHERRIGAALGERLPQLTVSLSSDVLPKFREYERFATTTANAYLAPRLTAYLRALERDATAGGLPAPLVMLSSGGVVPIDVVADSAAACVLSGPAGGVVGATYVAGLSGERDLLTFDMGGTSTDVATVVDGTIQMTHEATIAGTPIHLPAVDVHSVSAGGGSIAWVDDGRALRVGPRSAGARPGPACYGWGGTDPTVTDANLYLGYLADGSLLGGEVRLSLVASDAALSRLGQDLGLDPVEVATGVAAVANAEMVRALRVVSVERGLDPRDFTLVAFGGAGGMHACALAEELGIRRVLVPLACGVLSALGLAVGDLRRDYVRSAFFTLDGTAAASPASGATAAATPAGTTGAAATTRSCETGATTPSGASGGTGAATPSGASAATASAGASGATGAATPTGGSGATGATAAAGASPADWLFAELEDAARRDLPGCRVARFADCRYAGQSFELTVAAEGDLRARFEVEHERRYGHQAPGSPVEVVALRLVATVAGTAAGPLPPTPAPSPAAAPVPDEADPQRPPGDERDGGAEVDVDGDDERRAGHQPGGGRSRRRAWFGGTWREVEVVPRAAVAPGDHLEGPAIVEFDEATCVLRPGWRATVDGAGSLVAERS